MSKYITGDLNDALARAIAVRMVELREIQDEASKDISRTSGEVRAHAIETVARINQELEDLDRGVTFLAHRIRLDQGPGPSIEFVRRITRMVMEANEVGVPYV